MVRMVLAMTDKKAYTVQEAAKILSLGKTTVYELIWQNKLKHIKIGRKIIIPEAAIQEFIEANTKTNREWKECEQLEASKTFETQTQRISNSAWIRR